MNQLRKTLRFQQSLFSVQALGASMRMKPRDFESSRVIDQSRYEDAPPPTDDDMISKLCDFLDNFRGALLQAPSSVRVQRLWGVPCGQLQALASRESRILEHRIVTSQLTLMSIGTQHRSLLGRWVPSSTTCSTSYCPSSPSISWAMPM